MRWTRAADEERLEPCEVCYLIAHVPTGARGRQAPLRGRKHVAQRDRGLERIFESIDRAGDGDFVVGHGAWCAYAAGHQAFMPPSTRRMTPLM
jgi:hypothetical protein